MIFYAKIANLTFINTMLNDSNRRKIDTTEKRTPCNSQQRKKIDILKKWLKGQNQKRQIFICNINNVLNNGNTSKMWRLQIRLLKTCLGINGKNIIPRTSLQNVANKLTTRNLSFPPKLKCKKWNKTHSPKGNLKFHQRNNTKKYTVEITHS